MSDFSKRENDDVLRLYVLLLDEGIDVWRPVDVVRKEKGFLILCPEDYDPEDEIWEFTPGSVVEAEERTIGGEKLLVAVRLIETFL